MQNLLKHEFYKFKSAALGTYDVQLRLL